MSAHRALLSLCLAAVATTPAAGQGRAIEPLRDPTAGRWLLPEPGELRPAGPVPVWAPGPSTTLVGATVHTVTGPVYRRGVVVMRDGRVAAVGGDDVPIPGDAEVVDLSGLHVYPSLIAADTVLGLTELAAVRATVDVAEVGDYNPNVRPEVAVNPSSALLPVTRSAGILVAMTAPRGGVLAGSAAVIELDGWSWEQMLLKAPVGMYVNWPAMQLDRSPDARPSLREQKRLRDARIDELRDVFRTARAYLQGRAAARAGAPRQDADVKWPALAPVLEGTVPLIVRADDLLEIRAALDFAAEHDVRLVLAGGTDAWRFADELARRRVPVILDSVLQLNRPWEPYDVNFTAPAKLHAAGVELAFTYGSDPFAAPHARNLPLVAAKAVGFGLPRRAALEALTIGAARILGVDDRLGSLEPGKDATVIVTDGAPLDPRSRVHRAFIRGAEVDLTDRHKRLYERYRRRPETAAP